VNIVVPAVALTCIGVVKPPRQALSSRRTMDFGYPWDVIGTSNFLFRLKADHLHFNAFINSDGPGARTLSAKTTPVGGASNNSVQSCTAACFSAGYPLAGMEYSNECCTCHLSPQSQRLSVHNASKTVAPPSLTAALRHLRATAP
jgi:hypothetical protein